MTDETTPTPEQAAQLAKAKERAYLRLYGGEPGKPSNNRVLDNIIEARDNGYDLACVQCGAGMSDYEFEDEDMHDYDCPNRGRNRVQEHLDFITERLGPAKAAELLKAVSDAAPQPEEEEPPQ